jgi:magnesium transporter
MLTVYNTTPNGSLERREPADFGPETVWLDLLNPTREEDADVERLLGISIPTREEMQEIEASSRLYQEGGAHYMTATVLHQENSDPLLATPVTFILSGQRLATVRYMDPRAFALFLARAQKHDVNVQNGPAIFTGLIEAIIDREADRVERTQGEVDRLSLSIFGLRGGRQTRSKRFDVLLKLIGREGELTSRSRESLLSLDRMLTYAAHIMTERDDDKTVRSRIKTAQQDVKSLTDAIGYMSARVTFLLDATLGMINNEQNNIIKLFSVLAVALMPPTLVASIYGMNFKHMPELDWYYGYPLALGVMLLSGLLPYVYFRRKGWL